MFVLLNNFLFNFYTFFSNFFQYKLNFNFLGNVVVNSKIRKNVVLNYPCHIQFSEINDYTYVASNCYISNTFIGKFCSIGKNFNCGLGIHPVNGISTSPMFYSVNKQNGYSLVNKNKIKESKRIYIGNDVFVGINVTILDGVKIGNGAVIGACSFVNKDVPDYAIVGGNPAKIIRFRFNDSEINKLNSVCWWNWDLEKLKNVEENFFNVNDFDLN